LHNEYDDNNNNNDDDDTETCSVKETLLESEFNFPTKQLSRQKDMVEILKRYRSRV